MSRLRFNNITTPSTPATGKTEIYVDSTLKLLKQIDDTGLVTSITNISQGTVAASGPINTTETIVAGGSSIHPIIANSLNPGDSFRVTLLGTCTSTAANVSTFRIRFGTAGTTVDGVLGSATVTAANTGSTIPFHVSIVFTVRTIGATGTVAGSMMVMNTGTTGLSAVTNTVVALTTTTINTTVSNFIEATYASAATTTICTFQNGIIEHL